MEKTKLILSLDNKKNWKWISLGLITACDCFGCGRRISHVIKKGRVLVHCKFPCDKSTR